jgi:hypothetical protein
MPGTFDATARFGHPGRPAALVAMDRVTRAPHQYYFVGQRLLTAHEGDQ